MPERTRLGHEGQRPSCFLIDKPPNTVLSSKLVGDQVLYESTPSKCLECDLQGRQLTGGCQRLGARRATGAASLE